MKILSILILWILFLTLSSCQSNYEKGVGLLKEKKYEMALEKFKDISQNDDNYSRSLSKIKYIVGLRYYEESDFDKALSSLSGVSNRDEYKILADSLIFLINKSPKYLYQQGQKEFELGKYYFAYDKFSKIPTSTEEYKLCKSKLLFSSAYVLRKEDKLDSALSILQDISEGDPIFNKIQIELQSIERRKNYLTAKEYFEGKKFDNALKILQTIDEESDSYKEAQEIIEKIDQISIFNKYPIIKQIEYKFENEMLYINGNIKLPVQKTDWMVIYFDKFSEKNIFKVILPYSNYYFKDFKEDGGLNPKYGEVMGGFEVMLKKPYQLNIFNWKEYVIEDDKLRTKMSNKPNDYKICFIYKIDHITNNVGLYDVYSKDLFFYILDNNDEILYKSEEKEK